MYSKDLVVQKLFKLKEKNKLQEFEAIMLGGSVGRNENNEHSDIDIFLLCENNFLDPINYLKIRWVADQIGEVKLFSGPIFIQDFGQSFTALYDELFICQFFLNDRNSLNPNPMNKFKSYFVYDESNYYTNYLDNNVNFPINSREIFIKSLHRFWLRLMGASKENHRNNYWISIRYATEARENLITMKRISLNIYPSGLNFHKSSKNIENDIPTLSEDLISTLSTYSYESIVKSVYQMGEMCTSILEEYVQLNPEIYYELENSRTIFSSIKHKFAIK